MSNHVLDRVADADDRAFLAQVFQDYHRLMHYEAAKYIINPDAREDVVQSALLKAVQAVNRLRALEPGKRAAYLAAVTRNESFNHLRREAVVARHSAGSLDELGETPAGETSVEEALLRQDRGASLRRIWPRLTETERTLLAGRYLLGRSDEELARKLGCKTNSVRMMMTRARRKAAALLRQEDTAQT